MLLLSAARYRVVSNFDPCLYMSNSAQFVISYAVLVLYGFPYVLQIQTDVKHCKAALAAREQQQSERKDLLHAAVFISCVMLPLKEPFYLSYNNKSNA